MNIARVFAITMVCFGFACTLLTLCRLLLDRPSKRVRNIADASFTVYLVHFPLLNVFYSSLHRQTCRCRWSSRCSSLRSPSFHISSTG